MKHVSLLVLAALIALPTGMAFAQTTGELHGIVKAASGNAVPNARVTAKADVTGNSRDTLSAATGEFSFASLPVGSYSINVEAEGFKSFSQQYIAVTLGHVIAIDVTLEAGEATQVLAADAPLIERSSNQMGAIVNERSVAALPLNTRDTYQLLQLQPGVESQQGYDLFAGSDNPGVVSVNGGRARANNYNVNGGDANDLFLGLPLIQPSPDTIEEFRVLTSTYDAEFGRNSASVINVVTQSGSNEFHGSGYEFFRNKALNTRGFFDTEMPKFNQNQFGGTFGGPILKNRTFAFVSFEERQIRQGISSDLVTVPTAANRSGDFSDTAAFSGVLADTYLAQALNARPGCASAVSAFGGSPIVAGTPWSSIFRGNQVPSACFDATAVDLLNHYVPLPNVGTNEFQTVPVQRDSALQPTVRVDHTLNARNTLSFYYFIDDDALTKPFSTFQAVGANLPGFGGQYMTRGQQYNLSETWTINASTVNEARFNYLREGQTEYNHPQQTSLVQQSCTTVPAALCFSDPANPALGITPGLGASHEGVPFIGLNGAFSIGNNSAGELPQVGNTFQWTDNLSFTKGAHQMKFGIDARRQRFDQMLYFEPSGSYTFAGGGANDVGAENVVPDFLLGLPNTYSQGSAQAENNRNTAISLFAQDHWRVTPDLTLNYGLRWEWTTPMLDTRNRLQTFRPGHATTTYPCQLDSSNPLTDAFQTTACNAGSAGEAVFPLGLVVPGDSSVPAGLTATNYLNFAPRFGIAWSPSHVSGWLARLTGGPGKLSVRTGWGMFYNPIEQLVLEQFNGEPPFGGDINLSNPMFNTPFLGQDGTVSPNSYNGVRNLTPGQTVDWSVFRPMTLFGAFTPRLHSQYSENYNLTIQRQFQRDLLLQVAYVGSQGHHLLASRDGNYGLAQPCLDLNALSSVANDPSLACGPFSADSSFSIAANEIPAGFTLHLPYGPVPSVTGPNANPITLVGLRRYSSPLCNPLSGNGCPPDGTPVFGSIFFQDTIANSNYNSLQISLEKRAFVGLQFQAAYTFSKSIDDASSMENLLNPLNYRLSRSLSFFDARQRLVFSYVWDIPKTSLRGLAGAFVNNWVMSGIVALQTGFPIPITSSGDQELMNSFDFTYPGEPDLTGRVKLLDPRRSGHLAFDPSAFQPAQLGTLGSSPRTVCCGPGINNIDLALMKSFRLTEKSHLQFRTEVFNLANHAQFTKVDGNISDGDSFGTVLGARDPRLLQLALKLFF